MKISGRPVRTTILFGLLAALSAIPLITALEFFLPWPQSICLVIWATLALYGIILARWARTGVWGIGFPLLLLLLFALLGDSLFVFLLLSAGILSWIRSGICFPQRRIRAMATELLVSLGGGALVLSFSPYSAITWALGIWMFFLVQGLYFVLSGNSGAEEEGEDDTDNDPFERARMNAEKILAGDP